jgi:hypothetical protein
MKIATAFEVWGRMAALRHGPKASSTISNSIGYADDGTAPSINVKASDLRPNLGHLPKVFGRYSAENEACQRGVHGAVFALPFS